MISEMQNLYPTHLPLYYEIITSSRPPEKGTEIIAAEGDKYESNYGYALYVNEFRFDFKDKLKDLYEGSGANQPPPIVAIHPNHWKKYNLGFEADRARVDMITKRMAMDFFIKNGLPVK